MEKDHSKSTEIIGAYSILAVMFKSNPRKLIFNETSHSMLLMSCKPYFLISH